MEKILDLAVFCLGTESKLLMFVIKEMRMFESSGLANVEGLKIWSEGEHK